MIVIIGAGGQLGTAFSRLIPDATRLTRETLDLESGRIPAVIGQLRPSLIINCAAYTAVDRAEEEPDLARHLHATVVEELRRTTISPPWKR